jgi:hypothetical protein
MSRRVRFGELLSRLVPLSGHDVEEILQEQTANHRRFGEIALAWGLCRPEHVWDAWCQQSGDGVELVDLEKIGIDAQAAAMLPAETARLLGVIPVRILSDAALLATVATQSDPNAAELGKLLHRRVQFIRAAPEQLRRAIEIYYPVQAA